MAFNTPRSRELAPIQTQKRRIPLEQILAVQGQNPLATGIESLGNVVGQSLQQRAELQRQGQALAESRAYDKQKLAADQEFEIKKLTLGGKKRPLGTPFTDKEGNAYQYFYDEKTNETTAEPLPKGVPPPKSTSNPESMVFIGNDANGNPLILGNKSGTIRTASVPGGGSVLPKNQPATVQKDIKDIDSQIIQIKELRSMLTDVPSGAQGALTSVASKYTAGLIGGKTKQYNDIKPAVATKIYRALTGDTRLSDADAAARAYPLLPTTAEPLNVREAKLANLEKNLLERRANMMNGGGLKAINQPGTGEEPDVQAYAKKYGISYEEASAIKNQRKGKR